MSILNSVHREEMELPKFEIKANDCECILIIKTLEIWSKNGLIFWPTPDFNYGIKPYEKHSQKSIFDKLKEGNVIKEENE